jgi:hypothetical protein
VDVHVLWEPDDRVVHGGLWLATRTWKHNTHHPQGATVILTS